MNFTPSKPCDDCPFRIHGPVGYTRSGAIKTAFNIIKQNHPHACHKDKNQHCAGALFMLDKMGVDNSITKLAKALGRYNPELLYGTDQCFSEVQEFVDGQHGRELISVDGKPIPRNKLKTWVGDHNGTEMRMVAATNPARAEEILKTSPLYFRTRYRQASSSSEYHRLATRTPEIVLRKKFLSSSGWEVLK